MGTTFTYRRVLSILIIMLLIANSVFITSCSRSKPTYLDSLQNAIRRVPDEAARVELFLRLAKKLQTTDSALAFSYIQQALKLEEKRGNKLGIASAHLALGEWYRTYHDPQEAEKFLILAKEALKKDTARESRKLMAMTRINLAMVMGDKGYAQLQVEEYLKAIPILEQLNEPKILGATYQSLGDIFFNKAQYKTATTYYNKSLDTYADSAEFTSDIISRHLNLSSCMFFLDSLQQMQQHLADAKKKLDSMPGDSSILWASWFDYQGQLDQKHQMYVHATTMFNSGLSIARRYQDNTAICQNLYSLAKLHNRLGQYDIAMSFMNEYKALASSLRDYPLHMPALDLMADIAYKQSNSDQGYRFLREYITLSDSMQEQEVTAKLHELETQFQTSEKERRILQLQHENERQEFALQKNRLLISLMIVIMISLLVVAGLSYLFYRNGRKLLTQQEQLHQFEVDRIRQEHHISLLSAMLEGQEQERTRLARDLHDGLGGLLSGIKLELSTIPTIDDIAIKHDKVNNTLQRLDGAMDELRRIARSMMPEILIKYGLGEATVEYCRGLKKTGVNNIVCQVYNFHTDSMKHTRQVVLYRIMQELVNNAIKHAAASQILVLLQQTGDTIFLTIEDDGAGFDTTQGNKLKGAGLANIQARVDFLGGKMEIQSEIGTGTTITIECATSEKNDA
ncbi:sensor histidine kinase [Chitinophaga sp.]|uniref:tetratricopeptide repeat-containing sensor histidine kinase n=1 Tax=Chitinophaga sp. TaxID=1869181 RepID=UPI0031DAA1C9